MFFYAVNLAARRSGLAALVALGLSASAQENIQFTKPVDEDPANKANSFMPDAARHNPSSFNAPSPIFTMKTPLERFDMPPPQQFSPADMAKWHKFLDDRKNWTLMTPAEIMGIRTPEQILGIPDPNDDSKLPAEERYLKRQARQAEIGASNAWHRADAASRRNNNGDDLANGTSGNNGTGGIFQSMDGNSRVGGTLEGSVPGKARLSNLLFDPRPDEAEANQKFMSAWVSPFNLPDPVAKQTPEQLAGMERFRSILDGPVPEKPLQASPFSTPPAPAPNPNMQQFPVFNPAGESFRPLESDISKPMGLMPLQGVTGPHLPPPKKATSLTQPPPWMQNSFQNPTLPQRQF